MHTGMLEHEYELNDSNQARRSSVSYPQKPRQKKCFFSRFILLKLYKSVHYINQKGFYHI